MKKCQGYRRSWKDGVLATRKCRQQATYVIKVGGALSRALYACGSPDCHESLNTGYPAVTRELV